MSTRRFASKPIDPGVEACFGESHRQIFRGDLRIMASKRVRVVSVTIDIEEYADEAPTLQPQFLALVDAREQPDEGRWQKYAIPLVEVETVDAKLVYDPPTSRAELEQQIRNLRAVVAQRDDLLREVTERLQRLAPDVSE